MDQPGRRNIRIPTALAINVLVVALAISCCNPATTTHQPSTTVNICAEDPGPSYCLTGDFRMIGAAQKLQLTVTGSDGKPLANKQVALKVSGANNATTTLTTLANGTVEYSYNGAHAGTDTITATISGSNVALSPGPSVIHWLTPQHVDHPIILVHGIQEDASDFKAQIDPSFVDRDQNSPGERSRQTWANLFEALTTTYNPAHIEAFCYVDDPGWTNPDPACPSIEMQHCSSSADCISQSSVDMNAIELAETVNQLSTAAGGKKVTLLAYSMGGAIVRTLLAGCLNSAAVYPAGVDDHGTPIAPLCASASANVDNAFFMDGAQAGSWLMTVKSGFAAAALAGQGIPPSASSPFSSVLPLLYAQAYSTVKSKLGLDLNGAAETDLTPQSANIIQHNSVEPPANVQLYTFYGDDHLQLAVTLFVYTLPGKTTLPLGDLVMLAQDDNPLSVPPWGGGSLCGNCGPVTYTKAGATGMTGYHDNSGSGTTQYHAWVLQDTHDINMNAFVPVLSAPGAASALDDFINSPVQHLNVPQPVVQSPGSVWQVHDVSGRAGPATDMPDEILNILMAEDGLSA